MQANDCQTSWHSNASQCKATIKCLLFGLHSQQKNQGDTAKAETNNQPTCANDPTPAGIPMSPVINNNQPPALRLSYPQKIKEKQKEQIIQVVQQKTKNNNQQPASPVCS